MLFRMAAVELLVVTCALGQTAIYGPVTVRLKAGDLAPDFLFHSVVSLPGSAASGVPNLAGEITVVGFFPDTSHNIQSVSKWNALVEHFDDKPIQFVWITGERETTLLPWLHEHPLKGWVIHDPEGATGRAYGIETADAAIVGPDRRILGFDHSIVPAAATLEGVLDGHAATRPKSTPELMALMEKGLVLLDAEPERMPRPDDHKPNFPPSWKARISPAGSDGGGDFSGADYWSLQSLRLKDALARLYGINTARIDLPASLDDGKRYNFDLVLPESASRDRMADLFKQGIAEQLHLSTARIERVVDTYVVTRISPTGATPPKSKPRQRGMSVSTTSSVEFERVADREPDYSQSVGIDKVRGIAMDGSMDMFCNLLEESVDRPVVNETGLSGDFEFRVEAGHTAQNDFLDLLRDQLGLIITRAPRPIEVLTVRPQ